MQMEQGRFETKDYGLLADFLDLILTFSELGKLASSLALAPQCL